MVVMEIAGIPAAAGEADASTNISRGATSAAWYQPQQPQPQPQHPPQHQPHLASSPQLQAQIGSETELDSFPAASYFSQAAAAATSTPYVNGREKKLKLPRWLLTIFVRDDERKENRRRTHNSLTATYLVVK